MTTHRAVTIPTEKTSGDKALGEDKTTASPGRGPREEDYTSSVPDRQLNIRRR
jgi:hypothetical protein